ncbi:unnamed protein product [Lepeophtheirus salmonis]|uniref:(salmon louse) hypothetical protein n=1 Tax=Lepeophtheirus salmonis TaxID=72036 RepID=A0A7R8D2A6_LEPSM|nr:unnamed protein product [Lepeophtheirus salmonis]CAF3003014.1 unnamed protein product [Lepeophtheirus salmonis]
MVGRVRKPSEGKLFLDEARIRLQKAYESLEDHYMEKKLWMGIDPDQTDEYNTRLEEYNTQLEEYNTKCQEKLEKLLDTMSLNQQPAEPTLNKPPEPSSSIINIDNSLLPSNLTKDHNPHELAELVKSFKSYFTQNSIDKFPLHVQHTHFYKRIYASLRARISPNIQGATPVFSEVEDGFVKALEDKFLHLCPQFQRRLDFFQYSQRSGQSSAYFVANLEQKAAQANLSEINVDDLHVFLGKMINKLDYDCNLSVAGVVHGIT